MRASVGLLIFIGAAFPPDATRAYPDGAPWGSANPAAEQNCESCHFDYDAVYDSEAISIDGLPDEPVPDAIYDLTISFDVPETIIAGLQIVVQADAQETGAFVSAPADLEFIGAAIRSTEPVRDDDGVSWIVRWRAPTSIVRSIVFFVAASSANDDGSPFGDTVHFRTFELTAE